MNTNHTSSIYLDHAATTPIRPEAADAMLDCLRRCGNPSSLHSVGRAGREALDSARQTLADFLGCTTAEIIFTGGGTESDNLAVIGGSRMRPERRHVLVSAVEHHAVLHAADALIAEGFLVELLPVDAAGRVSPDTVAAMLRPETALVSVMAANNEIGTVQPVREIAQLCRANETLYHTDAVQALGHLPVNVREMDVDLLSLSAHKFGGPPGAGALYIREGVEIRPTLFGGAQERGRRGGTENWGAIAGMEAALRVGAGEWESGGVGEWGRQRDLIRWLRTALSQVAGTWCNTPEDGLQSGGVEEWKNGREEGAESTVKLYPHILPNILNVGFEGVRAETLLLALDLEGVAASSGSACASGSIEPSHVLKAIGLTPEQARSSIRFSVGWTTTMEEVERAAEIVERVVERIRVKRI